MKNWKKFNESKTYEEYYTYLLDLGFEGEPTRILNNGRNMVIFSLFGDYNIDTKDDIEEFVERIEEFENIKIMTWHVGVKIEKNIHSGLMGPTQATKVLIIGIEKEWFDSEIDPFFRNILSGLKKGLESPTKKSYMNSYNEYVVQYDHEKIYFYITGRVWDYLGGNGSEYACSAAIIETMVEKYLNWRIDLYPIIPRVIPLKGF